MFEFEVLTVKDVDFLNDQKQHVAGMQLYVIGASVDPSWNGWEVSKIWIPDGSPLETLVSSLKRGDFVLATFDRRGKLSALELLKPQDWHQ